MHCFCIRVELLSCVHHFLNVSKRRENNSHDDSCKAFNYIFVTVYYTAYHFEKGGGGRGGVGLVVVRNHHAHIFLVFRGGGEAWLYCRDG